MQIYALFVKNTDEIGYFLSETINFFSFCIFVFWVFTNGVLQWWSAPLFLICWCAVFCGGPQNTWHLATKTLRISITLSLACNPLACCMLRVKPRFHFSFISVIMKMDRNSHNYSQTVIQYLLSYGHKSTKISQKSSWTIYSPPYREGLGGGSVGTSVFQ